MSSKGRKITSSDDLIVKFMQKCRSYRFDIVLKLIGIQSCLARVLKVKALRHLIMITSKECREMYRYLEDFDPESPLTCSFVACFRIGLELPHHDKSHLRIMAHHRQRRSM